MKLIICFLLMPALLFSAWTPDPVDVDGIESVIEDSGVECQNGYYNAEYWYLNYEDVYRPGSESSVVTNDDIIETHYITGLAYTDKRMSYEVVRGFPGVVDSWSSSDTSVATVDAYGYASMVTSGTAVISAVVGEDTKSESIEYIYANVGTTYSEITGYASGSLRESAITNIDSRISGGDSVDYWTTFDHSSETYTRNTNSWAESADLSGVVVHTGWGTDPKTSPYGYNTRWHGTLITEKHILLPKHCMLEVPNQAAAAGEPVGATKRFVGKSGTIYERTVTAHLNPYTNSSWSFSQDIIIGRLSSALPTNDVAVYSVMPANYTNYLPNGYTEVPALVYEQNARCYVADMITSSAITLPVDATRQSYFKEMVAGDSGRPVFLWLGTNLVYQFGFTYARSGATSPIGHRDAINTVLVGDGGYSLTDYDMSVFNSY